MDPITAEHVDSLAARGFVVPDRRSYPAAPAELTVFGGANAIFIDPADGTMVGVGDPRRQGVAVAPRAEPTDHGGWEELPECWRSHFPAKPSSSR